MPSRRRSSQRDDGQLADVVVGHHVDDLAELVVGEDAQRADDGQMAGGEFLESARIIEITPFRLENLERLLLKRDVVA